MSRDTRVTRGSGVDAGALPIGPVEAERPPESGSAEGTERYGGARPCLWMSAGLVSYKLCDRAFDCEHCPLDAALRGEPLAAPGLPPGEVARVAALSFPEDRLYGRGHTWVQEAVGRDVRIGLDAFAVALIGSARRLRLDRLGGEVREGQALGELDLGIGRLVVCSPVAGRLRRFNRALDADAAPLLREPYGEGWIVELTPSGAGALGQLCSSVEALDRARLDLRRFRRRAALFLFDHSDEVGPTLQDGGEVLTDLRCILGPSRFVELIGDLIR